MDFINIMLLVILATGVIGNNQSVAIAVSVLLFIRLANLNRYFPYLEEYGLQTGIIILTIGVLAPLASGKIEPSQMIKVFTNIKTIIGVLVGIFVAYLGGKGVNLLSTNPLMVTSIMIGTIIGVAFLRGIPVGPLIAAGITSLALGLFNK